MISPVELVASLQDGAMAASAALLPTAF